MKSNKELLTKSICHKVIFSLLFFSAITINQAPAQNFIIENLEEVVVTSSRTPVEFSNVNRSVFVLDKFDIAKLPVDNIQDVLDYAVGVDVQTRGPNGVQADLSIRGSNFEQVLVLVDGIKVSNPQTGHHHMNIPVDISNVEKIEIMRGHGSRLYGPNAFGGVINIITQKESKSKLTLKSSAGDFGLKSGSFRFHFPVSRSSHSLGFSKNISNGYIRNSEFDISTLNYASKFQAAKIDVGFSIDYQDKKYGASTFYSDRFPNQWEHTEVTNINLSGNWGSKKLQSSSNVYYQKHKDDFILDSEIPDFSRNQHTTDVFGVEIHNSWNNALGITSFGGEYSQEELTSTNLGDHQRNKGGVYIENHSEFLRRFYLTIGVFAYYYSDWDWKAYPGLDLGVRLSPNLRLFGTVGGSFRVPTFTELYYTSPANIGNPDLKPESAISYEVGSVFNTNNAKVLLSVFHRNGRRVIDWVRRDGNDPWEAIFFTNVNTNGIEVSSEMNPRLHFKNLIISRINAGYSYLDSDRNDDEYETKYGAYVQHQAILGLTFDMFDDISLNTQVRFKKRVDQELYSITDSKISKTWINTDLYLSVTNIFDVNYTEVSSVEMPGRWIKVGITYRI